jgi:hypothetical protein
MPPGPPEPGALGNLHAHGAAALPAQMSPGAGPLAIPEPEPSGRLRRIVRRLDALLRQVCEIREFSHAEWCLLRIAIGSSDRDFTFADGTCIRRGEPIGELHLWNEHVPPLPERGPDLGWALQFRHRLRRSLHELSVYVERDPAYRSIRAFRGEGVLGSRHEVKRLAAMARAWGFDVPRAERQGWRRMAGDFWRNLYAFALLWAFNPGGTKGHALRELRRDEFWITREALTRQYGRQPTRAAGPTAPRQHAA